MKFARLISAALAALSLTFAPAFAFAGTSSSGGTPASLTRMFTSSTTDTVPGWATGAYFTYIAGGQAGTSGGSGGTSGNGWREIFAPVTPGSTLTITIGAGGSTSGAAGGSTTITGAGTPLPSTCPGGNSGTSCFIQYAAGTGTVGNAAPANFMPGQAGAGASSALACIFTATTATVTPGQGGCTVFGKGGDWNNGGAASASAYGAGGGGTNIAGVGGVAIIRYVP